MFTTDPKRSDATDVEFIKMYKPNSYVRKYAVNKISGFRDFEIFFDYAAWLNGNEQFMKQ